MLSIAVILSSLLPQQVPAPQPGATADRPRPRLVVVTGALHGHRVVPTRLGFGTGGFDADGLRAEGATRATTAEASAGDREPPAPGRTPGGALVRAQPLGARIDLPSGAGLLVDATARVILRDGTRGGTNRDGLRLWLGDGTRVLVMPSLHRDRPPRLIACARAGQRGIGDVLWRTAEGVRLRTNDLRRVRDLWVLGEGDMLYRAVPIGPMLVLDREVARADSAARFDALPARAVVVLGDILAVSLLNLPGHVRLHSSGARELEQRADGLAAMTRQLLPLPARFARPVHADHQPEVVLGGGMRLRLHAVAGGMPHLRLLGNDQGAPLVEWSVSRDTILHLMADRAGDRQVALHYAVQGLRLNNLIDDLVGYQVSPVEEGRARTILFEAVEPPPVVHRAP